METQRPPGVSVAVGDVDAAAVGTVAALAHIALPLGLKHLAAGTGLTVTADVLAVKRGLDRTGDQWLAVDPVAQVLEIGGAVPGILGLLA